MDSPVKVSEIGAGMPFQTRLTGRKGVVMGSSPLKGVLVEWIGTPLQKYLHWDILVNPLPSVLRSEK